MTLYGVLLQVTELTDKTISSIPDSNCTFIITGMSLIILILAGVVRALYLRNQKITDNALKESKQFNHTLDTIIAHLSK